MLPEVLASIPRRAYYLRTFKNSEMLYHVCASYASAHEVAQRKVGLLFGGLRGCRRPGYLFVALESARSVAAARNVYETIHHDVVGIIKTNLAASNIVDMERELLFRLQNEGVLSHIDSCRIAQDIKNDSHLLTTARSQRAHSLADALGFLDTVGVGSDKFLADVLSRRSISSLGESSPMSRRSFAHYGSTASFGEIDEVDDEHSDAEQAQRSSDSVMSVALRLRKAVAKVTGFHGFFTARRDGDTLNDEAHASPEN